MLEELQRNFRLSIQNGQAEDSLISEISNKGIPADQRVQIYQNNYQLTLTDNLQGIFPLAEAFVGDMFLKGAIKHFIAEHPPKNAALDSYGEAFGDFFESYEPAEDVFYIADLIRLEWAIHALQHVNNENGIAAIYQLNTNIRIIESDYPLLNLWMVGNGQLMPEAVHLEQGGQNVCVVLVSGEIQLFSLSEDEMKLIGAFQKNVINDGTDVSGLGLETLVKKGIVLFKEP